MKPFKKQPLSPILPLAPRFMNAAKGCREDAPDCWRLSIHAFNLFFWRGNLTFVDSKHLHQQPPESLYQVTLKLGYSVLHFEGLSCKML